jgi:hypothetical protein
LLKRNERTANRKKYYYLFSSKKKIKTFQEDKPIGLEKANFEIRKNQNRYRRYLTFADGIEIIFSPRLITSLKNFVILIKNINDSMQFL